MPSTVLLLALEKRMSWASDLMCRTRYDGHTANLASCLHRCKTLLRMHVKVSCLKRVCAQVQHLPRHVRARAAPRALRAQARGAPILAEYLGGAVTCDAYHMTDPRADGLGVSTCINLALKNSGIERDQARHAEGLG